MFVPAEAGREQTGAVVQKFASFPASPSVKRTSELKPHWKYGVVNIPLVQKFAFQKAAAQTCELREFGTLAECGFARYHLSAAAGRR
jgi:hypothetical protein